MLEIVSTDGENAVLDRVGGEYTQFSEMTLLERRFLNSLVLRHQPKKILEIGVSSGASSVILLNAIRDCPDAVLHSIDYSPRYYMNPSLKSGFVVDSYPDLQAKYRLRTGGLALEFMEEIGDGIDFCFIDTMHRLPGELLDYLMVLPSLRPECVVVFHDTRLHTRSRAKDCIATCLMMSAVKGEKMGCVLPFDPRNYESDAKAAARPGGTVFANIGGVRLSGDAMLHAWDVLNLLTLPWSYHPSESEVEKVAACFGRHYGADAAEFLRHVAVYQEYRAAVGELGSIQGFGGMSRLLFGLKSRCREMFYLFRSGIARGKKRGKYARRIAMIRNRSKELLRIRQKYASTAPGNTEGR